MDAAQLVATLQLAPHPEGGYYRETWRAPGPPGERSAGTAIYYLLLRGQRSCWHRIDAAETWHFYAGAPLSLQICAPREVPQRLTLGVDLAAGQRPQLIVPAQAWQQAESLGEWSLVGCTVAPAFEFDRFELAAPGFDPTQT